LIVALLRCCYGFAFEVAPRTEACFYEVVTKEQPIGMMFQVTAGGFLDIDVNVIGPDRKSIYSGTREQDGRYSFSAPLTGSYSFCFSNIMSTVTAKQVQLSVTVGNMQRDQDPSDIASEDEVSPIMDAVVQLEDAIAAIEGDQEYLKMREYAHRNTNESTNDRVVWWSFFEILILLSMSVWQVYYLKRFFEVRRVV